MATPPDVIWSGENAPESEFQQAREIVAGSDLLIAIGTSGEVAPASSLVKACGGRFVEIYPEWTWLTPRADLTWRGRAPDTLPELLERVVQLAKK